MALGVNFAGHGSIRIYNGVGAFAAATAEHMAKSPLPHGLVLGFGHCIPWIEVLLGAALIVGLLTRLALVSGAGFMMALTIGVTANQQWDVASQQLVYSVVFFFCSTSSSTTSSRSTVGCGRLPRLQPDTIGGDG